MTMKECLRPIHSSKYGCFKEHYGEDWDNE